MKIEVLKLFRLSYLKDSFVTFYFIRYFYFNINDLTFNDIYWLYNIFHYLIIKNTNINIHYRFIKISI